MAIADVLVLIFALFASWLCAVMFTKPIKRIGISIEEIAKGNMYGRRKRLPGSNGYK